MGHIKQVQELKFLGVIFDEKLSFRSHLNRVCDKTKKCLLSSRSCALTNFGVPASYFAQIFIGAFLPKLLYGLPLWYSVFQHKGPLELITKSPKTSCCNGSKGALSTSNEILFPLASCHSPALLLKKELLHRTLTICTSSFFSEADLTQLLTTELSFQIHQLIFQNTTSIRHI